MEIIRGSEQWDKHKSDGYICGFSDYEHQYMTALENIVNFGYSDGVNERTGHETKRLPGVVFQIDVEKQFPILKSKKVYWKSAIEEILWIMQKQSNSIKDLRPHIWDEWADADGRINSCYGYQVNRPVIIRVNGEQRYYPNQVSYVLDYLKEFPNGRWAVLTLWNVTELYKMNLCPCCHTSTWNLDGGRLNCLLDQRSGDMPVGVPFNTTQYAALMCMFAKHLGVKPGILTHVIADAHVYDNQMDLVKQQISEFNELKLGYSLLSGEAVDPAKVFNNDEFKLVHGQGDYIDGDVVRSSRPKLIIDEFANDFWKIDISNIRLVDYESNSYVKYPVVK